MNERTTVLHRQRPVREGLPELRVLFDRLREGEQLVTDRVQHALGFGDRDDRHRVPTDVLVLAEESVEQLLHRSAQPSPFAPEATCSMYSSIKRSWDLVSSSAPTTRPARDTAMSAT